MAQLFGLNIDQIVADAFEASGGLNEGTLYKDPAPTRDPNNPTKQIPGTPVEHKFQGYIEFREVKRDQTVIAEPVPIMVIIAKSVKPAATPEVNDRVEMKNIEYVLDRLVREDPAEATLQFQIR